MLVKRIQTGNIIQNAKPRETTLECLEPIIGGNANGLNCQYMASNIKSYHYYQTPYGRSGEKENMLYIFCKKENKNQIHQIITDLINNKMPLESGRPFLYESIMGSKDINCWVDFDNHWAAMIGESNAEKFLKRLYYRYETLYEVK